MWTFTEDGFFSTVVDRDDPTVLAVRSRDAWSIKHFCDAVGLDFRASFVETPERDYPYRVRVRQAIWVGYIAGKAEQLDYVDYKAHCQANRARPFAQKQTNCLGKIWALMVDGWEVRSQNE